MSARTRDGSVRHDPHSRTREERRVHRHGLVGLERGGDPDGVLAARAPEVPRTLRRGRREDDAVVLAEVAESAWGAPLDPKKVTELIRAPKSTYRLTPDTRLTRRFGEMRGALENVEAVLTDLAKCLKP